jgi:WD40 repeat protein
VSSVSSLSDIDTAMLSPNGNNLAVQEESAIKLWDVATGRPLRSLEYFAFVTAAQFTPDGKTIITGYKDGSIRVWDIATGVNTVTLQEGIDPTKDDAVRHTLWIDEQGELVISGDENNMIGVWSIAQRKRIKQVKFGPDGGRIDAARLLADSSRASYLLWSKKVGLIMPTVSCLCLSYRHTGEENYA